MAFPNPPHFLLTARPTLFPNINHDGINFVGAAADSQGCCVGIVVDALTRQSGPAVLPDFNPPASAELAAIQATKLGEAS